MKAKKMAPAAGALFNQQQSGSSQPHYNSKNARHEGDFSNATGINFYNANAHLGYPYSHNNGPQTSQGTRINSKSPGRSNAQQTGGGANNFAPMSYGATAVKQQYNGSMAENYAYSIPSDNNNFYAANFNSGPPATSNY